MRGGWLVIAALASSRADAQPTTSTLEPRPLRRGWVAAGVGGEIGEMRWERHWMMEGGARPTELPLFFHGMFAIGHQDFEDFGDADWTQFRLGVEAFGCVDKPRILCGFATADLGYLAVRISYTEGRDSPSGYVLAARFGADIGTRFVRLRIAVDWTRRPGDHFEREYLTPNSTYPEWHFDWAKMTQLVIAGALQF